MVLNVYKMTIPIISCIKIYIFMYSCNSGHSYKKVLRENPGNITLMFNILPSEKSYFHESCRMFFLPDLIFGNLFVTGKWACHHLKDYWLTRNISLTDSLSYLVLQMYVSSALQALLCVQEVLTQSI